MPRIRSIKPQFWIDENLGKIKRDARLLYIGLWNLCDDLGVFEYRPARIKAQLFPYDTDIGDKDINDWLELLKQTGDIITFSQNGGTFGYIPTFLKHQEIKRPSQWHYAEVPPELRNAAPLPYSSPTTPPSVDEDSPTTHPALPIGSREGGVGSSISTKVESTTSVDNEKNLKELTDIGKKAKKEPPEWVTWKSQVFAGLAKRRQYNMPAGKRAGEARQMSWLFKQGYKPDDILRVYDKLKLGYWADKPLTLMSLAGQIGEVINAEKQAKETSSVRYVNQ